MKTSLFVLTHHCKNLHARLRRAMSGRAILKIPVAIAFAHFSVPLAVAKPFVDQTVQRYLSAPDSLAALPVIVAYTRTPSQAEALRSLRLRGDLERSLMRSTRASERAAFTGELHAFASPISTLWIANASLAVLNPAQIRALMGAPGIQSITSASTTVRLDPPAAAPSFTNSGTFTYGLQKIGIPALRVSYPNILGSGVRVGILDSGIDPEHPDLKGKVVAFKDFTPDANPVPTDGYQHGTHVAGTIAGGSVSGEAIGIAPEAKLVIGKMFDGNGESVIAATLKAMQWMADPDGNPETNDFPTIVNGSWGHSGPYNDHDPEDDPYCRAVDSWVKLGIVPVFSAGNADASKGSINLPAGCPGSFSVNATNINDQLLWFSAAGPAIWKSSSIAKPDVVAPGLDIKSAMPGGGYQLMSGTSMATPHVAGSLALIQQAVPGIGVAEAEKALIAGSQHLGEPGQNTDYGWGRPDLPRSIQTLKLPSNPGR